MELNLGDDTRLKDKRRKGERQQKASRNVKEGLKEPKICSCWGKGKIISKI